MWGWASVLLWCATVQAQQGAPFVRVALSLGSCVEQPVLMRFDGSQFFPVAEPEPKGEGQYEIRLPKGEAAFYYVGANSQNMLPVLLGSEEEVRISGNCQALRNARIEGSPLNARYQELKQEITALQQEGYQLSRRYGTSKEKAGIEAEMLANDEAKLALLEKARSEHPLFGLTAAFNTYLSYPNNREGYGNEIEYYAQAYFKYVDWEAAELPYFPWVFEGFRTYTTTLASTGINGKRQIAFLEQALQPLEAGGVVHKMALSGIVSAAKQRSTEAFLHFAKAYVAAYQEQDPNAAASMQQEIEQAMALMEGSEAPDFSQQTPEGELLSLSSLRGKIVLIDFWASWCGPCRKENPNVVKLYDKYKSQGFEILGVSLDRKKENWLKAIEADGLSWPQVSDLKGWQNEVAAQYGVRSIPYTVLVDRDGTILARKLRGAALEAKLAALFGGE